MARSCTSPSATSWGFDRNGLPLVEAIAGLARRLWPHKTAINLASRAGVTHRAAENWLAGNTGVSGDALAELLRSDVGLLILEEIMSGSRPSWWPAFKVSVELDQVERAQEATAKKIEALRDALK